MLIQLNDVIILVYLWLPYVLALGLLVLGLRDTVFHGDFFVKFFEEVLYDLDHLFLLLLFQLFLFLFKVFVLGIFLVAFGEPGSIEHVILV